MSNCLLINQIIKQIRRANNSQCTHFFSLLILLLTNFYGESFIIERNAGREERRTLKAMSGNLLQPRPYYTDKQRRRLLTREHHEVRDALIRES